MVLEMTMGRILSILFKFIWHSSFIFCAKEIPSLLCGWVFLWLLLNYGSDSYEEDIAETETDESSDYDSEDAYEDDFIFDDDMEMYSPSPVRNSGGIAHEVSVPLHKNANV